jgi:ABC-type transport system involved in cytochrome c biogenesis permease subunit
MLLDHFLQSGFLFQVTTLLYLLSLVMYCGGLVRKSDKWTRLGFYFLTIAFAANSAVIIERWMTAGRAPFKTLYETMLFYPWCISFVFFLLFLLYRLDILGPFTALGSLIGFVYAAYKPDIEIINLPPALQSAWFVPHVVTYFIAYAALFASFSLAILFLLKPEWRNKATKMGFEQYHNDAVNFGFVALTLGLVMGSAWGHSAWGNYWAWDPKENWALITWFIYLIAVHLRFVRGWKGKRAAFISIAGFCAVIFTYLGMSLLPTASGSLHVYQ